MMQQNAAQCHSDAPTRPQIDTVAPLPRLAGDRSSWLQAVHWVHGAGIAPQPKHSPKFGETTVRLAELLADLTPCRPTVAYLARRLKASERTVQYHLRHLERAGLLAPLSGGTRLPRSEETGGRVVSLASEWERTIPAAFDDALGIRTIGEGRDRRPVGIAEEHRATIGDLAKMAARKIRKRRSSKARCTPMEGGTPVGQVEVGGDVTTTGGAGANESTPTKTSTRSSGRKRRTVLGRLATNASSAYAWTLAQAARRHVPWVRNAKPNELWFQCQDPALDGMGEREFVSWLQEIAAVEYRGAGLLWQPEKPAGIIAQATRRKHQDELERAAVTAEGRIPWEQSTEYRRRQEVASLEALFAHVAPAPEPEKRQYTAEERAAAQLAGRYRPQDILDHRDAHGEDDAFDLYGVDLVAWADRLDASSRIHTYA